MSETPPVTPDRTLLTILALIATITIVAIVVVLNRGMPEPLDPSTPEGTVQRYASAIIDSDEATATSLLSPAWLQECNPMDYGHGSVNLRLTLISTDERDKTATVKVSVATHSGSGPFDSSGYEHDDAFQLEKVDGEWLVRNAPWEFASCPVGGTR